MHVGVDGTKGFPVWRARTAAMLMRPAVEHTGHPIMTPASLLRPLSSTPPTPLRRTRLRRFHGVGTLLIPHSNPDASILPHTRQGGIGRQSWPN